MGWLPRVGWLVQIAVKRKTSNPIFKEELIFQVVWIGLVGKGWLVGWLEQIRVKRKKSNPIFN